MYLHSDDSIIFQGSEGWMVPLFFFNQKHSEGDPTVKIFIKNKLKSKLQEDTYRGELGCKTERKKRSRKALCTRILNSSVEPG